MKVPRANCDRDKEPRQRFLVVSFPTHQHSISKPRQEQKVQKKHELSQNPALMIENPKQGFCFQRGSNIGHYKIGYQEQERGHRNPNTTLYIYEILFLDVGYIQIVGTGKFQSRGIARQDTKACVLT